MTTKYSPCDRCGRPRLHAARVLSTGRIVCFSCYEELEFGPDNLMIDDGIARTWEETKRLRTERRQAARQARAKKVEKSLA
jgi:recombinational DNA repair protein (RecF pathway)